MDNINIIFIGILIFLGLSYWMADKIGNRFYSDMIKFIIKCYKDIKQVCHIYFYVENQTVRIVVFTSNEKYDDMLMDRLLDQELKISGKFEKTSFDIRYISKCLKNDPKDYIPDYYVCVYSNNF